MKNKNLELVVDVYQDIDTADQYGYEVSYYDQSGEECDGTIVDLKYGFKSEKSAKIAGQAALRKLNKKKK